MLDKGVMPGRETSSGPGAGHACDVMMAERDGNMEARSFSTNFSVALRLCALRVSYAGLINEPQTGFTPNRHRQVVVDSLLGRKGKCNKVELEQAMIGVEVFYICKNPGQAACHCLLVGNCLNSNRFSWFEETDMFS